jgi:thioredoxin reductase
MSWRLGVIGAGPAGIGAATEAARQGSRPLLLDRSGRAGGTIRIAHEVRNLPFVADRVEGSVVAGHLEDFLRRWDVTVRHARVTCVAPIGDSIEIATSDGTCHVVEALVVAVGTQALVPQIDGLSSGSDAPGFDALFPDALNACCRATPDRAVVIGGSDVAMDQARWLRARGVGVEVLSRGATRAPQWLVRAACDEGVVVREHAKVVRGTVHAGGLQLVVRQGEEESVLRVNAVVAAIGRKPVVIEGLSEVMAAHPTRVRVVGDATGRRARHVMAALGDGCVAAVELLAKGAE